VYKEEEEPEGLAIERNGTKVEAEYPHILVVIITCGEKTLETS